MKNKQNNLNWDNDKYNRATCEKCPEKLPNHSTSKLCSSCEFVSDYESRKPVSKKTENVQELISKSQERIYLHQGRNKTRSELDSEIIIEKEEMSNTNLITRRCDSCKTNFEISEVLSYETNTF